MSVTSSLEYNFLLPSPDATIKTHVVSTPGGTLTVAYKYSSFFNLLTIIDIKRTLIVPTRVLTYQGAIVTEKYLYTEVLRDGTYYRRLDVDITNNRGTARVILQYHDVPVLTPFLNDCFKPGLSPTCILQLPECDGYDVPQKCWNMVGRSCHSTIPSQYFECYDEIVPNICNEKCICNREDPEEWQCHLPDERCHVNYPTRYCYELAGKIEEWENDATFFCRNDHNEVDFIKNEEEYALLCGQSKDACPSQLHYYYWYQSLELCNGNECDSIPKTFCDFFAVEYTKNICEIIKNKVSEAEYNDCIQSFQTLAYNKELHPEEYDYYTQICDYYPYCGEYYDNYCEDNAETWECLYFKETGNTICIADEISTDCTKLACNSLYPVPQSLLDLNVCPTLYNSPCVFTPTKWNCSPDIINYAGCNAITPTDECITEACHNPYLRDKYPQLEAICPFSLPFCDIIINRDLWQCVLFREFSNDLCNAENALENGCAQVSCNSLNPIPPVLLDLDICSELFNEPCLSNPSNWNCDIEIINYTGCNQDEPSDECINYACLSEDLREKYEDLEEICNPTPHCSIGANQGSWECLAYTKSDDELCNSPLAATNGCADVACNILQPIPQSLLNLNICPTLYEEPCLSNQSNWNCNPTIINYAGCNQEDPSDECIGFACENEELRDEYNDLELICNPPKYCEIEANFDTWNCETFIKTNEELCNDENAASNGCASIACNLLQPIPQSLIDLNICPGVYNTPCKYTQTLWNCDPKIINYPSCNETTPGDECIENACGDLYLRNKYPELDGICTPLMFCEINANVNTWNCRAYRESNNELCNDADAMTNGCAEIACNSLQPVPVDLLLLNICPELYAEPCKSTPGIWNCDPEIINYNSCNEINPGEECIEYACHSQYLRNRYNELESLCFPIEYCGIDANKNTWNCKAYAESGNQLCNDVDAMTNGCLSIACNTLIPIPATILSICPEYYAEPCKSNSNLWNCDSLIVNYTGCNDITPSPECISNACRNIYLRNKYLDLAELCNPPTFCQIDVNVDLWQCIVFEVTGNELCNTENPTTVCADLACNLNPVPESSYLDDYCQPIGYCNNKYNDIGYYQCSSHLVNEQGCNREIPSPECLAKACELSLDSVYDNVQCGKPLETFSNIYNLSNITSTVTLQEGNPHIVCYSVGANKVFTSITFKSTNSMTPLNVEREHNLTISNVEYTDNFYANNKLSCKIITKYNNSNFAVIIDEYPPFFCDYATTAWQCSDVLRAYSCDTKYPSIECIEKGCQLLENPPLELNCEPVEEIPPPSTSNNTMWIIIIIAIVIIIIVIIVIIVLSKRTPKNSSIAH